MSQFQRFDGSTEFSEGAAACLEAGGPFGCVQGAKFAAGNRLLEGVTFTTPCGLCVFGMSGVILITDVVRTGEASTASDGA